MSGRSADRPLSGLEVGQVVGVKDLGSVYEITVFERGALLTGKAMRADMPPTWRHPNSGKWPGTPLG